MIDLNPLFSTVAQVAFTLTGLMFIAVAGDPENRKFWLGYRPRAVFVYICFMMLLLPGLLAIGGLIFTSSSSNDKLVVIAPSWPIAAAAIGSLYLYVSRLISGWKNQPQDYKELLRLDKKLPVIGLLSLLGLAFILLAILGGVGYLVKASVVYSAYVEIAMGVFLGMAACLGGLIAIQFLRFDYELKEPPTGNEDDPSQRTALKMNIDAPQEPTSVVVRDDASVKRSFAVLAILLALMAFVVGALLPRRTKGSGR